MAIFINNSDFPIFMQISFPKEPITIDEILEVCQPTGFLGYLSDRVGEVMIRTPAKVYQSHSPVTGYSPQVTGGWETRTVPSSLLAQPVTIVRFEIIRPTPWFEIIRPTHSFNDHLGDYFVEIDGRGVRNVYYYGENPAFAEDIHSRKPPITLIYRMSEYNKPILPGGLVNVLVAPSRDLMRDDKFPNIPFPGLKGQT